MRFRDEEQGVGPCLSLDVDETLLLVSPLNGDWEFPVTVEDIGLQ